MMISRPFVVGATMFFAIISSGASAALPITYIDLGGVFGGIKVSLQTELAVQVCAGIYNRNPDTHGAVYTIARQLDVDWIVSTKRNDTVISKDSLTPATQFLQNCLQVTNGYMRYSWQDHKIIVPNLITIAAVLDAVPLHDLLVQQLNVLNVPVKFDALQHFPPSLTSDYTNAPRIVTEWMLENYGNQTTGVSKMNPGLDVHGPRKVFPPLTKDPNLGLVDFIVKERLFNFFLYLGCIPLTDDHALMEKIATSPHWKHPLVVMGYDDTMAAGGDVFEAETDCVSEHNMGQVASDGCSNLSFYSIHTKMTIPLLQVPNPPTMDEPYNANITYLTIVMGDGDNLNFVKDSRRTWMTQRVAACGTNKTRNTCFPLVWSMSPAATFLMPDVVQWYYQQSFQTLRDWFVLPPSGHLYAYPGEMNDGDQAAFVAATEQDAWIMNTSATVSWEFTSTWNTAIRNYFPRYSQNGVIQACFAVNVPYFVPIRAFGRHEHYKILGGNVVLFAPREWRGKDSPYIPFVKPTGLSPAKMAAEVNGYPKGTVSHIYATSDGGFDFDQLTEMVGALEDHVQLVGSNEIALRAKQRDAYMAQIQGANDDGVGMEDQAAVA